MPGRRCSVLNCNKMEQRLYPKSDVTYHRFPKDAQIRKQWVVFCRRKGHWNPAFGFVCSDHFKSDDFIRDLKAELLGMPIKKRLKPDAIPSVRNNEQRPESSAALRRRSRMENKAQAEARANAVQDALDDYEKNKTELEKREAEMQNGQESSQQLQTELMDQNVDEMLMDLQLHRAIQEQNRQGLEDNLIKGLLEQLIQSILNDVINNLDVYEIYLDKLAEYYKLQKELISIEEEHKLFKGKTDANVRDLERNQITNDNMFPAMSRALSNALTPNQIALLLNQKKLVKWTPAEIFRALSLRYLSCKAYMYMRSELNYPLPGLSSLRRWAANIEMRYGLLHDVLGFMEVAGRNLETWQRLTVLQIGEMKVSSQYEYDQKHDEVVGPYSHMHVIMARGLCESWKMPIFVDFDTKITRSVLLNVSSRLLQKGFKAIACVTDSEGSGVHLRKELGITIDMPYFTWEGSKIYMFADAPHLLKLLRNWLLDTGFTLEDNTCVNAIPLKALLQLTNRDLNVCQKLSPSHLLCEKREAAAGQNVDLASQLLSQTTATALLQYAPGEDRKLAVQTGNFIKTINDWYDVMNSCKPEVSNQPLKSAYGNALEEQDEVLDKAYDLIDTMHCTGKGSKMLFQKHILESMTALRMLYNDVCSDKVQHVMTKKLTLDSLENFFSKIRSESGSNEHPAPLQAIYTIRMLILGKQLESQTSNTDDADNSADEEFLISSLLHKTNISCIFKERRSSSRVNATVGVGEKRISNLTLNEAMDVCQENVAILNSSSRSDTVTIVMDHEMPSETVTIVMNPELSSDTVDASILNPNLDSDMVYIVDNSEHHDDELEVDEESVAILETDSIPDAVSSKETTTDVLYYLAGWIAKKYCKTHKQLSDDSGKISGKDHSYAVRPKDSLSDCADKQSDKDHSYSLPPWAVHLLKGGMIYPKKDFLDTVSVMEKLFVSLHSKTTEQIIRGPKVMQRLTSKISENVKGLDRIIIQAFIKQRLIIRMNFLNYKASQV